MIYPEYDSPINIVFDKVGEAIAKKIDDKFYEAFHNVNIDIDEKKMLEIIKQDSQRYRTAYQRGYEIAKDEQIHCEDCENYQKETGICISWGSWTEPNGYCYKGETKNDERTND